MAVKKSSTKVKAVSKPNKAVSKSGVKPVAKSVVKPVKKAAAVSAAKAPVTPAVSKTSFTMPSSMTASKLDAKKLIKPLIVLIILGAAYLLKDEVIVASVNGKPVTRFALIQSLEQQSASAVLENLTLQMLVQQELKKAGIVVTSEELDQELTKIEEQLSAQGQNLDDLLKAQGLTRAQVKEQLALSKGLEKLLADKVTVSQEEIAQYFEENKEFMGDVKLEDVLADIEAQVRQEKLSTEQQKWFAEISKNADIKYYKFAPSTSL